MTGDQPPDEGGINTCGLASSPELVRSRETGVWEGFQADCGPALGIIG